MDNTRTERLIKRLETSSNSNIDNIIKSINVYEEAINKLDKGNIENIFNDVIKPLRDYLYLTYGLYPDRETCMGAIITFLVYDVAGVDGFEVKVYAIDYTYRPAIEIGSKWIYDMVAKLRASDLVAAEGNVSGLTTKQQEIYGAKYFLVNYTREEQGRLMWNVLKNKFQSKADLGDIIEDIVMRSPIKDEWDKHYIDPIKNLFMTKKMKSNKWSEEDEKFINRYQTLLNTIATREDLKVVNLPPTIEDYVLNVIDNYIPVITSSMEIIWINKREKI